MTDKITSGRVLVEALQTIGFYGVVIRPGIGGKRGQPPLITPVKAVIPAELAASYGPKYVRVIGPARPDAALGQLAKGVTDADVLAAEDPPAEDPPPGEDPGVDERKQLSESPADKQHRGGRNK